FYHSGYLSSFFVDLGAKPDSAKSSATDCAFFMCYTDLREGKKIVVLNLYMVLHEFVDSRINKKLNPKIDYLFILLTCLLFKMHNGFFPYYLFVLLLLGVTEESDKHEYNHAYCEYSCFAHIGYKNRD